MTKLAQEHEYPKPWHVWFNGTVASVYSTDGDCVPWELVEAAMNQSLDVRVVAYKLIREMKPTDEMLIAGHKYCAEEITIKQVDKNSGLTVYRKGINPALWKAMCAAAPQEGGK